MRSRRKLALIWLAWFAALNVLWLIFISAWVAEEAVLGLVGSAIAAAVAVAVHSQELIAFRPQPRWFLRALRLPLQTVRESGIAFAGLARRLAGRPGIEGRFRTVRIDLPDDPAESAAKRALLILAESFAPNGYVLGIDEKRGLMLTHELHREEGE
jgi:hypothetical protein